MSVTILYQTSARAIGGRDGYAATPDGSLDVKLTTPKELGGAGGEGTNPEQLEVGLAVSLPGMERAGAESLMESAHQVCPYSHATRGNIDVKLSLA